MNKMVVLLALAIQEREASRWGF